MAMLSWSNRLRGNESGNTVLEFAFLAPFLFFVLVTIVDIGRSFVQANTIEKSLNAGALYLARSATPLTGTSVINATNLVKTGTLDGSGSYLVNGWGSPDASLTITTRNFTTGDRVVPVIRLDAVVPYLNMMPGLNNILGLPIFTMKLSHEQAYIGD